MFTFGLITVRCDGCAMTGIFRAPLAADGSPVHAELLASMRLQSWRIEQGAGEARLHWCRKCAALPKTTVEEGVPS